MTSKFLFVLIALFLLVNINPASALKLTSKKISILKLSGIIFALGYLMVFLGLWIYQTGFQSYIYIVVGEPNLFIKYGEWILGIIAILYLIMAGKNEADNLIVNRAVSYDPLV